MDNKAFGPPRSEVLFRLIASVAGLALLAIAIAIAGVPTGPAFFETVVIAGGFFGGTAVWAVYRLWR